MLIAGHDFAAAVANVSSSYINPSCTLVERGTGIEAEIAK